MITPFRRDLSPDADRFVKHCRWLMNSGCAGLAAGFEYEEPLWELRIGDWRIFYDVDEEAKTVMIRAIRYKEKGKTTGEKKLQHEGTGNAID